MKSGFLAGAVCLFLAAGAAVSSRAADPMISSWLTRYSGQYARIYSNDAAVVSGTTMTTWARGSVTQAVPAYAGVQEVAYSTNWVYIRTSGLGTHTMGPWYLNVARNQNFPNFPKNQGLYYKFPRTNSVPATKTLTGLGVIGYFVDGVAMFDNRDGYYWNGSAETSGAAIAYWNRDAITNEGVTLDAALAHQEQSGTYHYHGNVPALRYLLGDNVSFNPTNNTYSEKPYTTNIPHSPIIAWIRDGEPLYGPYGYSNPTNPASTVVRMRSGYVLRNGQYGSQNLNAIGRTNIPAWAVRVYNVSSNQVGPPTNSYALGRYLEDYEHLSDLGYPQTTNATSTLYDLDEYNGRWCVTPEYPNGVYAHFETIASNGAPVFPYHIGRVFHGNPVGAATTISDATATNFTGNTASSSFAATPMISNATVTITWKASEGGTYTVETSPDLATWSAVTTNAKPANSTGATNIANTGSQLFTRITRTAIAAYDTNKTTVVNIGGAIQASAPGGNAGRSNTVYMTITIGPTPPVPPVDQVPTNIALATNIIGTALSRVATNQVAALFVIPTNAPVGLQPVTVNFAIPTFTSSFTIN